jgi:LysR family transcriptional regulator, cyn operon transcriptional activator
MTEDGRAKPAKKSPMGPEHHLKLRQIKVYLEAARHENFGAAARSLGVSTTYVSESIAALEQDLGDGVVLFERSRAGTKLSAAGRVFVERAEALISAENAARRAITNLGHQTTRVLKVACEPSLVRIVNLALRELQKKTQVSVEFLETDSSNVARKIRRGDVEVGLIYLGNVAESELDDLGVLLKVETSDGLAFVTHDRHHLDAKVVSADSLRDEPFAFPWVEEETAPGWTHIRRNIQTYFEHYGFTPRRVVFRSNSPAAVLTFVQSGRAATIHPIADLVDREGLRTYRLPKGVGNVYVEDIVAVSKRLDSSDTFDPPSNEAQVFLRFLETHLRKVGYSKIELDIE